MVLLAYEPARIMDGLVMAIPAFLVRGLLGTMYDLQPTAALAIPTADNSQFRA